MIKNTLNAHYSYSYYQPEDYRFSLDSVFLAQKVAIKVKERSNLSELKILDLCSGCGVVGLELQFHARELKKIDFLEIQNVYRDYFEKNCEQVRGENLELNFLNMNYESLLNDSFKETYDIIVSNPPYFFQGEGLLSPNDFKNRCRFFIDSSFQKLIEATLFSLRPDGLAFLLMRPGSHHGRDLVEEIKKLTKGLAFVQIFDEVRGTNIIMLSKKI
ncbi:MAG: methyltransferase [Bdellovibrionales bacterium]|nr:methyltransferase [Bdellovibrionales bacterium]